MVSSMTLSYLFSPFISKNLKVKNQLLINPIATVGLYSWYFSSRKAKERILRPKVYFKKQGDIIYLS
jgi:hypothetical protein